MVPELTDSEEWRGNGRPSSDLREGQTKLAVMARFTVGPLNLGLGRARCASGSVPLDPPRRSTTWPFKHSKTSKRQSKKLELESKD